MQLRWQHPLEDAEAPCDDRAVAGHAGYLVRGIGLGLVFGLGSGLGLGLGLGSGLGLGLGLDRMATVLEASHSLSPAAKWPSRLKTVLRETTSPSGLSQSEAKPPSSALAPHQLSAKMLLSPG